MAHKMGLRRCNYAKKISFAVLLVVADRPLVSKTAVSTQATSSARTSQTPGAAASSRTASQTSALI